MKKILLYTLLIFTTALAMAQFHPQTGFVFYNNNNFAINNYAGFSLSYSTPLPVRLEGYSQLNDSSCPNVPIIFSTDGINVHRGSDGFIVATGLLGSANSTNAATIVPIAGSRALIITTKSFALAANQAYSSIIGYTGGCTGGYTFVMPAASKNLQLISSTGVTNMAEKVTVMPIAGSTDYWLLMHEATNTGGGSNKYLVFRISYLTGVITAAADYNVGLPIRKIGGKGQMQAVYGQFGGPTYFIGSAYFIIPGSVGGATDRLRLNPSTGVLTFTETILQGSRRPYGLEFSRSANWLYVSYRNFVQTLTRYDNSLPLSTPGITNAYTTPTPLRRFGQIQRTDNDDIYIPYFNINRMFSLPISSSPTSFSGPITITTGAGNFYFGLPNYWRN